MTADQNMRWLREWIPQFFAMVEASGSLDRFYVDAALDKITRNDEIFRNYE